jgi:hypothetical protein
MIRHQSCDSVHWEHIQGAAQAWEAGLPTGSSPSEPWASPRAFGVPTFPKPLRSRGWEQELGTRVLARATGSRRRPEVSSRRSAPSLTPAKGARLRPLEQTPRLLRPGCSESAPNGHASGSAQANRAEFMLESSLSPTPYACAWDCRRGVS